MSKKVLGSPTTSMFWQAFCAGQYDTLDKLKIGIREHRAFFDPACVDYDRTVPKGPCPDSIRLPSMLTHEKMLGNHMLADWSRAGSILREFAARFYRRCASEGIPIYFSFVSGIDIRVEHYHLMLSDEEWRYISVIAQYVIQRHNLPLSPGPEWGHYVLESENMVPEIQCTETPLRLTPTALFRSLPK